MKLNKAERTRLLNELYNNYAKSKSLNRRVFYFRKKYSWIAIVEGAKFFKRGVDIFISFFSLIILSPLMLLIAIIIKIYDGGPVLYVTDRVGMWGKEFRFLKFRTMKIGANEDKEKLIPIQDHPKDITFKMKTDPRTTPFGKLLRKSSLDELPQLLNVLKGEMALVGPRPPLPEEVSLYNLEQRRRLDIKPGITCIWQISGRSEIPFAQQVELDREYIESQSLWLDVKILLKTIPAIIFGRGAY